VTLHYRAWRWNDEEPFESTYEGEPMKFTTDSKKVIPGTDCKSFIIVWVEIALISIVTLYCRHRS
jgi:hypothetical protein